MSISELIREKCQKRGRLGRDIVEITRPVVNIFCGDDYSENIAVIKKLSSFIYERVGKTNKIQFLNIFTGKNNDENGADTAETQVDIRSICLRQTGFDRNESIVNRERTVTNYLNSAEFKEIIHNYVAEISNITQQAQYQKLGQIRLNFIIKSDSYISCILFPLVIKMKEHFKVVFANGVLADSYCLLCQEMYQDEEQNLSMSAARYVLLNDIYRLNWNNTRFIDMTYVLSDFSSGHTLVDENLNERIECIGLNILMKDGKSQDGPANINFSTFDEGTFINSINSNQYGFYSLGSSKFGLDYNIRDLAVYKAVLQDICKNTVTENQIVQLEEKLDIRIETITKKYEELCTTLMQCCSESCLSLIPKKQKDLGEFLTYSNQNMIERIYGKNLDLYWEMNNGSYDNYERANGKVFAEDIRSKVYEAFRKGHISFGDVFSIFNHCLSKVAQELSIYRNLKETSELEKNQFDSSHTNVVNVRNGYKEYQIYNILARNHFDKVKKITACDVTIHYLSSVESVFNECKDKFEGLLYGLKAGIEEFSKAMSNYALNVGNDLDTLLYGNMDGYYNAVTTELISRTIAEDYKEWRNTKINKSILEGSMSENAVVQEIMSYSDTRILVRGEYIKDFTKEIVHRLNGYRNEFTSENRVYQFALSTIRAQENYYIYHQEGNNNIHHEVSFFSNLENQFLRPDMHDILLEKIGRNLKWFLETNDYGMEILFMQGRFSPVSIHAYSVYQKAYEQLKNHK